MIHHFIKTYLGNDIAQHFLGRLPDVSISVFEAKNKRLSESPSKPGPSKRAKRGKSDDDTDEANVEAEV